MYEPGEIVKRYCSIFPATVAPWQAPLPVRPEDQGNQALMLRAIVTERYLTVGWQVGQNVYRVDIDIDPEQAAAVTNIGGQVGEWTVGRRSGCRCNANLLSGWDPFPGVFVEDAGNTVPPAQRAGYGLIPSREPLGPVRYSRA